MLKKLLTYICMFLVAGMGFFGIGNNTFTSLSVGVYATNEMESQNEVFTAKTQDTDIQKAINQIILFWNIVLGLLTAIVSPAIMMAGWLMSPDWTSGDMFGIRPLLHSLWVIIANVTYFIYAVLLIFIALATIFNSDKYGYKQLLPKLALGILLVPLTWWFIQFIISLSSIMTASVMNIPMETLMNKTQDSATPGWYKDKLIPNRIEYINDGTKEPKKIDCKATPDSCMNAEQVLGKAGGIYSPLLIYGYAIFKVQDIKTLDKWSDKINTPFQIAHQIIFGSLMFVVFGLLVLALVFMLMMRAIKLWFYAIFSPLMTLKYVIGDGVFGSNQSGKNSDSFEIKEFIGLAFVPALVGLSLSFGLMILSVLQSSNPTNSNLSTNECTPEKIKTGCEIIGIMGNKQNKIVRKVTGTEPNLVTENEIIIGGITWSYQGKINSYTDATSSANTIRGVLSTAGGIVGTVFIDIIALVFIWVAFMAAKNVSKAVKAAVSPFEELGSKIGKLGMSLPKYAPILPGGLSISGANKLADRAVSIPDEITSKKTKESKLGTMLGMNGQADTVALKKAHDYIKNDHDALNEYSTRHKEILSELMKNGDKYIEKEGAYKEYMEKMSDKYKDASQITIQGVLERNGMNTDSAKIIAEKIKNGKTDLGSDPTLLKAWKETATKSGSTNTSNNTAPGFTQSKVERTDGKNEWNIKMGDTIIKIDQTGVITPDTIAKLLKEGKDKWTKEEFAKNMEGLSSDVQKKILDAIPKEEDKFYKKKP